MVIAIEEMMMKCMSAKRIIVALGRGNMKGLSMLLVFYKASNSVTGVQLWTSLISGSKTHQIIRKGHYADWIQVPLIDCV